MANLTMRFGDGFFLRYGSGDAKDIQIMKWIDSTSNFEADPTILMTAIDYGAPPAIAAFKASHLLPPDTAPYSKHFVHAHELQAEGLIPPDIDLGSFFRIAYYRKIPPEEVVIELLARGARKLKRGQTSSANGN